MQCGGMGFRRIGVDHLCAYFQWAAGDREFWFNENFILGVPWGGT